MKFIFSTVYRVTQKGLYACPYTSVWAPVVTRQISKWYSSSCHVFISMWGVISSTASMTHCLKSATSQTFLLYTTSLINPHAKKSNGIKSGDLGGQAVGPEARLMRTLFSCHFRARARDLRHNSDLAMLTIKSRRFSIYWTFTLQFI
jgi:hypothetical protein